MSKYGDHLKSTGASEADIAILDTPVAQRAFEKQQADAQAVAAERDAIKKSQETYQANVDTWYEEQKAKAEKLATEATQSAAKAARAEAALRVAHDRGMVDVAKDLGYQFDGANPPANPAAPPAPPAFDASQYVPRAELLKLAELEGNSIAMMSDVAAEHQYLFGSPLRNARELRAEATQRKISLEAVWMEKYGVTAKRAERAAADQKAKDDAIRADERSLVVRQYADKYGNPDTRTLVESRLPLAPRPNAGREKMPWDIGTAGEDGSNDRVRRAMTKANERAGGVH